MPAGRIQTPAQALFATRLPCCSPSSCCSSSGSSSRPSSSSAASLPYFAPNNNKEKKFHNNRKLCFIEHYMFSIKDAALNLFSPFLVQTPTFDKSWVEYIDSNPHIVQKWLFYWESFADCKTSENENNEFKEMLHQSKALIFWLKTKVSNINLLHGQDLSS